MAQTHETHPPLLGEADTRGEAAQLLSDEEVGELEEEEAERRRKARADAGG